MTELAQTARDVLEQTTDPQARWERLQEVARRFVQLRREESNADRAHVERERWEQKQAEAKEHKHSINEYEIPGRALFLQESYLEEFCGSGAPPPPQVGAGLADAIPSDDAFTRSSLANLNPTQSD